MADFYLTLWHVSKYINNDAAWQNKRDTRLLHKGGDTATVFNSVRAPFLENRVFMKTEAGDNGSPRIGLYGNEILHWYNRKGNKSLFWYLARHRESNICHLVHHGECNMVLCPTVMKNKSSYRIETLPQHNFYHPSPVTHRSNWRKWRAMNEWMNVCFQ